MDHKNKVINAFKFNWDKNRRDIIRDGNELKSVVLYISCMVNYIDDEDIKKYIGDFSAKDFGMGGGFVAPFNCYTFTGEEAKKVEALMTN
jgi:hypothetical protein